MAFSLSTLNATIRAKRIKAKLVQDVSRGLWLFEGAAVRCALSPSVPCAKLNDLTIAQWLDELSLLIEDSKAREHLYPPPAHWPKQAMCVKTTRYSRA